MPSHSVVKVAGVVVTCMRPPTRSGVIVVFVTLEDEAGLADAVVFPNVYDKYGPVIFNSPGLIIEGKIERSGQRGLSIIARKIRPLTPEYRDEGIPPDTAGYPARHGRISRAETFRRTALLGKGTGSVRTRGPAGRGVAVLGQAELPTESRRTPFTQGERA